MAAIDPDNAEKENHARVGPGFGVAFGRRTWRARQYLRTKSPRLDAEMSKKRASQTAASAFFKKW